jgi:predicted transposase YbfD/YdcC
MTNPAPIASLITHFNTLEDPRLERHKAHLLIDMRVIAIGAVICGADDVVAIARFGRAKQAWFETFLELPHGIRSHATFNRVFALLSPSAFQRCFANWVEAVVQRLGAQIVAVDGKTLRRSYDTKSGKAALPLVSAWAVENRVVLGQLKTEEHSNESTAIPELLRALALQGCSVTIAALGCQKAIAEAIIDQGADYVLALKGNQGTLHEDVQALFEKAHQTAFKGLAMDYYATQDTHHGRHEFRRHWTISDLESISQRAAWAKLSLVGLVESERHVNGEITLEHRYYIASLADTNAHRFAHAVRRHWGVENSLHWVLDVAFREDDSRIRLGHAQENLATLRHIALNLLHHEKTAQVGMKNKRLSAGWDENYLAKVLSGLAI